MLRFIPRNIAASQDTEDAAASLMRETGMDEVLCRILCMRGITDKQAAEDFLMPSFSHLHDPYLFSQMHRAVDRIEKARQDKESVCIYGDYDVDGICATSILYTFLRYRGMNVRYYIPSRQTEGYGMNMIAIDKLHDMGVSLIITVDNGIVAHDEIAHAYELGMQVIITDHHKSPKDPPECEAVLCHTVEGESYPNKCICGAGTALKLVQAIGGDDAAREFLPFAGLATVADIVDLTGENRAIVHLALAAVNAGDCPIGIKALTDVAKAGKKSPVTERDFAFALAPRLNAAGRMESAVPGVELLCEHDADRAKQIAEKLDALNTVRRDEEQVIVSDALAQIDSLDLTETRIIILKSEKWNPGIVGIAASRISERFYRPCILLCEKNGFLTGSGRSTPEIDLYDAMYAFSDMYIKFGGHAFAAGVTLKSESFDEYREKINEYVVTHYPFTAFIPKKLYDYEADISKVTVQTAHLLEKLAPFGEGNPKPVLLAKNVKFSKLQRIGAELTHLNGKLTSGGAVCDFVSFDRGYMFDDLVNADSCDISFSPIINSWANEERLQLRILDFAPAHAADAKVFFEQKNELFMDSFVRNLKFSSAPEKTPQPCSSALLRSLLKSSCDGTLILCTDTTSAVYVSDIIDGSSCDCDVVFRSLSHNSMSFNTLCAAPDIQSFAKTPGSYFRIILCGSFTQAQAGAVRELFPKAQIFVLPCKTDSSAVDMIEYACDRKCIGKVYTCMNKLIRQAPLFRDDLISRASELCGERKAICTFCVDTFIELDLFFTDKNGRINPNITAKKTELTESPLYRAAQSFRENILQI